MKNNIKAIRKDRNIKVAYIANHLGIKESVIYKWERGIQSPSAQHLIQLSNILGASIDNILANNTTNNYTNINNTDSVHELSNRLDNTNSENELKKNFTAIIASRGMNNYFYKQIFRGDLSEKPLIKTLTNLPKDWIEEYKDKKYASIDPTWDYSVNNNMPISSDELYSQSAIDTSPLVKDFFNNLHSKVTEFYYAIPIHGRCCSATLILAVDKDTHEKRKILRDNIADMSLLGHKLFDKIHQFSKPHAKKLSKTEAKVIKHLATGKTPQEIVRSTNILEGTVYYCISSAKKKLGAKTREELILLAGASNLLPHNFSLMRIEDEN